MSRDSCDLFEYLNIHIISGNVLLLPVCMGSAHMSCGCAVTIANIKRVYIRDRMIRVRNSDWKEKGDESGRKQVHNQESEKMIK